MGLRCPQEVPEEDVHDAQRTARPFNRLGKGEGDKEGAIEACPRQLGAWKLFCLNPHLVSIRHQSFCTMNCLSDLR
jgi:hypothetical protein